jgi:hypothetical protein
MVLREEQVRVIVGNPLGDTLTSVRLKLRDCANVLPEGIMANLLGVLVTSLAALDLPASDGNMIFRRSYSFYGGKSGEALFIQLDQFRPLVRVITSAL